MVTAVTEPTKPIEPTSGTYQAPPDCYRCGRPFAEHNDGQCPQAPPDCGLCGRPFAEHRNGQCPGALRQDVAWGAAKGLGMFAVIVAVISGVVWVGTTGSAHACTITGQLDGGTCYPFLNDVHSASGPLAIVLLIVGAVMLFAPTARR
jgi:hypothetical protein